MSENSPAANPAPPTREGQRIAKVIARAGLCSRRDAEAWIQEGRVSVNGKILESPAFNVGPEDDVRVDGVRLQEPERTRLFLFHKPRGLVTTARDPDGRPTIFDSLPEELPRVVAVGRLDINTEGLILLTNDGGLARVLELPATAWLRRYRVRAHGAIDQSRLDALREGVTIDGIHYAGIEARLEREQGSNVWLMMGLREGKNREIKRVLEHLGLSVNRLIRVSFGPFELGDLAEGEVAEVRTRVLRDQLGVKLAREARVNFDGEIVERAAPPPPPAAPKRGERRSEGRERPERGRPEGRERFERGGNAPRRAPAAREPEPERTPRNRKHVTALRAEIEKSSSGPRRRVERGATSDRKGREVQVERIVAPPSELRRRAAEEARRERGRKKSAERREERAPLGEDRPPARAGAKAGAKPFGKRPPSGEGRGGPRGEGKPFEKRAFAGEDRAPSRSGDRPFGKRPPSGEGRSSPRGEGRAFEPRAAAGDGRAPARSGGKSFGKSSGKPSGKRPSSGEGRFSPRGEGRAPPRGGKPDGGRPTRRS